MQEVDEIDFIEKYIALEKIRIHKTISIHFEKSIQNENIELPPMIFLPFIENAFKYGVSTKEATSIVIKIHATPNQIAFEASNTIATNISTHLDSTGIGINNAKRRLALLYPGMHQLNITSQDNTYQVSLHINC
mgnify:CR=1 FL=1